jgi:hypothetical protein
MTHAKGEGVLDQEKARQQFWADLGLPDPIWVETSERITRNIYGVVDFTSPHRAPLDSYFETNPQDRPEWW